jgi:CRISPR-associated protein Cmr1
MSKSEVKVTFQTITPLWTGDAWMENHEIRPSSLIGSLRFWFEVICYFGGICSERDFDKEKGRFEKDIKNDEIKKRLLKYGTDFDGQIEALKELEVPLPAIIFGTTGWKSLIEIKEINFNDKNFEEVKNIRIISGKNWFWKKIEYNGELTVIFRVPKEIKETIFFPLLNFMDKYGYWGGGWNIGYGRLNINRVEINKKEERQWKKDEFDFSKFCKNKIEIDKVETKSFDDLTKIDVNKKILKIQIENFNPDIKEIIKELVKKKAKLKLNIQDKEERHKIFGSIKSPPKKEFLPQGSKILPYINTLENNTYECGLLSIAGILNLYQEPKNE